MFIITFPNLDNLSISFDCELLETSVKTGKFKDHPKFNVTMTTCSGLFSDTFDYYESVGNFDMGENEYPNFLLCVMDDVLSSQMSFDDFCREFGYKIYDEEDDLKYRSIWQVCQKNAEKCITLGLYPIAADIINAINEEEFTITED